MKRRLASLALCVLSPLTAFASPQGLTRIVSLGDEGQPADDSSFSPAVDAAGRRIAFTTNAKNLVGGQTPQFGALVVFDLASGELLPVSVTPAGDLADGFSSFAAISADGTRVAFSSGSDELVANDTNGVDDVFLRDLTQGTTQLVSVTHTGGQASKQSILSSISADGNRICFHSDAPDLVASDTNGVYDVFVRDVAQGWTRRVSVSSLGVEGDQTSTEGQLSADGEHVAFFSGSSTLAPGDTNGTQDVFVHHLQTGVTELVSLTWNGSLSQGHSRFGHLNADGTKLMFTSFADDILPGDINPLGDVFLRDLNTGAVELVNQAMGGGFAVGSNYGKGISPDGRFQLFLSSSGDLVPGDTNSTDDVFVRDALTGTIERVSLTSSGQQVPFPPVQDRAAMSADARVIAFQSYNGTIVPNDLNPDLDVFVRERWNPTPTVAGYCTPSTTSVPGCDLVLQGLGVPSVAAPAGFSVEAAPALGGSLGILFFGLSGPAQTPFGSQGGFDCIDGQHVRAPVHVTGGTLGACDGAMVYTLDEIVALSPGSLAPGATMHAQVWMRDAGNPDGFALTSGVWYQLVP